MRTIESIQQSLSRFGYAHLRNDQHSLEDAQMLAAESGGRVENATNFHFTLVPCEAPAVSGADWEEVRKKEQRRKLKLAERKKRKTQNEQ